MRILIQWEDVPLELQRSNGVHRLRTAGGMQVAAPEIVTKAEGISSPQIIDGEHLTQATMCFA